MYETTSETSLKTFLRVLPCRPASILYRFDDHINSQFVKERSRKKCPTVPCALLAVPVHHVRASLRTHGRKLAAPVAQTLQNRTSVSRCDVARGVARYGITPGGKRQITVVHRL